MGCVILFHDLEVLASVIMEIISTGEDVDNRRIGVLLGILDIVGKEPKGRLL